MKSSINYKFVLIICLIIIFCVFLYFGNNDNKCKESMAINPKIGICTLYTDNIENYAKLTTQINQKYADKWGYDFQIFTKRFSNDRAPQWEKIISLLIMMRNMNYDYILWIDADAYFNDFERKIEDVFNIQQYQNNDLFVSTDSPYGKDRVNTGVILIKNTEWCKNLLDSMWNNAGEYLYNLHHEQSVLGNYYDENVLDARSHMIILPSDDINNSNPINKMCFICHMMAQTLEYRIYYANQKINAL